jgi:probable HAF family extracellular repeat protein
MPASRQLTVSDMLPADPTQPTGAAIRRAGALLCPSEATAQADITPLGEKGRSMSAISGRRYAALLLLVFGWIALSADLVEAGQSGAYSVVDIGALEGHDTSVAYSIDEEARVAGFSSDDASVSRAFVAGADGELLDLGADGERSFGWDIGADGQVVGIVQTVGATSQEDGPMRAVLWTDGTATELPTLGGDFSQALAINDSGDIAGASSVESGTSAVVYACRWQNGQAENLGTLGGYSVANDLNDQGWIVGGSGIAVDGTPASVVAAGARAVLWQDGEFIVLGTLGGDISQARAINETGQIAGYSTTGPDQTFPGPGMHAFLWEDGTMTDLGTLTGGETSLAFAINEAGQVVGTSISPDAPSYVTTGYSAVLWHDGAIANLNDLIPADSGWWLSTAYGINDAGQIVGAGYYYGRLRGFVLTPMPA